jgi:hypothetical protein
MDIATEKANIIKRINEINDESLIRAIKSMLDFGLNRQLLEEYDEELEASLKEGIRQSNNREVRPHKEVWEEIRKRYPAPRL